MQINLKNRHNGKYKRLKCNINEIVNPNRPVTIKETKRIVKKLYPQETAGCFTKGYYQKLKKKINLTLFKLTQRILSRRKSSKSFY